MPMHQNVQQAYMHAMLKSGRTVLRKENMERSKS